MSKTTSTMSQHFKYLDSLGMVVNKTKTEFMFMKNKNCNHLPTQSRQLMSYQRTKEHQDTGNPIWLWHELDSSCLYVSRKTKKMINGLKILRQSLNQEEILRVITPQYYGRIFYAIAVWHSSLSVKLQNKLETLHCKAL